MPRAPVGSPSTPASRARSAGARRRPSSGRSATARWATSSPTTRAATRSAASSRRSPSLPLDENVTIVAEVLEVRERTMRSRRGSILEAKISDGTGILTLTFFNQAWRARELVPGRARHLRRQGGRLPGRAPARAPRLRALRRRGAARRGCRGGQALGRGADPDLPGHGHARELAAGQVDRAAARRARRRRRPGARMRSAQARSLLDQRRALEVDPPPRGRGRLEGGAAHAAIHRGVRAADGAAAAARGAARAHDDRAASVGRRAPRAVRRLAAVLAHRRPAGGRRRDRRRPRAPGADEPARAGRGRARARRSSRCGRCSRSPTPAGSRRSSRPPRCSPAQHLRSIARMLGPDLSASVVPTLLTGQLPRRRAPEGAARAPQPASRASSSARTRSSATPCRSPTSGSSSSTSSTGSASSSARRCG